MSGEPTSGMSRRSRSRYGDGADVVLVAVGQHERLDLVEAVPDRLEVGQDQVDAGVVLLGEQHAAVDDEQPPVVLEDGHVAADLAQAAERDDPQAALGQRAGGGELGMGVAHAVLMDVPAVQRRGRYAELGDERRRRRARAAAARAVVQHAEQLQRGLGGHRALGAVMTASTTGSSRR